MANRVKTVVIGIKEIKGITTKDMKNGFLIIRPLNSVFKINQIKRLIISNGYGKTESMGKVRILEVFNTGDDKIVKLALTEQSISFRGFTSTGNVK